MPTSNGRFSIFVSSRLPAFVRQDHQTFVAFLEAYFEFLEKTENPVKRAADFLNFLDIDKSIDRFIDSLYGEFLNKFPPEILADKKLVMKHASEFYRAKGTEKSIRFLMLIMFGEDVEFYYPSSDVLRASDGKWYIEKVIRVTDTTYNNIAYDNLQSYVGRTIKANVSNAQADVDGLRTYFENGVLVNELVLKNILGGFLPSEYVTANYHDANGDNVHVSSRVFGGFLNAIIIDVPGSNYHIGDPVELSSNTGAGANAVVYDVSSGNIKSIFVDDGGAGYLPGDNVIITGGGGSGAKAVISVIDITGAQEPYPLKISLDLISLEANTIIGNATYSNLISANANTVIANALHQWIANIGPARGVSVVSPGSLYLSPPMITAVGNSRITNLGIIGRMYIRNGGLSYANGDNIIFNDIPGGYGVGALGKVLTVNASGSIRTVGFANVGTFPLGGVGYDAQHLPNVQIQTVSGHDANIEIIMAASGAKFTGVNSTIGAIEEIRVLEGGEGYLTPPTISLKNSGDGLAQAHGIIVEGVLSKPGRFLNDDGKLSSTKVLEDADYYNSWAYVLRIHEAIKHYRDTLLATAHPAGLRLYGEYTEVANLVAFQVNDTIGITNVVSDIVALAHEDFGTEDFEYYSNSISGIYLDFVHDRYKYTTGNLQGNIIFDTSNVFTVHRNTSKYVLGNTGFLHFFSDNAYTYDFNTETFQNLGMLIEGKAVNLFSNNSINLINSSVINTSGLVIDVLDSSFITLGNNASIQKYANVPANVEYIFSVYAQSDSNLQIYMSNTTAINSGIQFIRTGVYRYWKSGNVKTTDLQITMNLINGAGNAIIQGLMLEQSVGEPTSYVFVGTAREADNIMISPSLLGMNINIYSMVSTFDTGNLAPVIVPIGGNLFCNVVSTDQITDKLVLNRNNSATPHQKVAIDGNINAALHSFTTAPPIHMQKLYIFDQEMSNASLIESSI